MAGPRASGGTRTVLPMWCEAFGGISSSCVFDHMRRESFPPSSVSKEALARRTLIVWPASFVHANSRAR